jgi:hypothetical protein
MTSILRLSNKEALYAWEKLAPVIDESLQWARFELTLEDVRTLATKELVQVWCAVDDEDLQGVMTTELVQYPHHCAVRVLTFTGRLMDDWTKWEPLLEQYAREVGAQQIEAFVRPGLVKLLKPLGYEKAYDFVMKRVQRETH